MATKLIWLIAFLFVGSFSSAQEINQPQELANCAMSYAQKYNTDVAAGANWTHSPSFTQAGRYIYGDFQSNLRPVSGVVFLRVGPNDLISCDYTALPNGIPDFNSGPSCRANVVNGDVTADYTLYDDGSKTTVQKKIGSIVDSKIYCAVSEQ